MVPAAVQAVSEPEFNFSDIFGMNFDFTGAPIVETGTESIEMVDYTTVNDSFFDINAFDAPDEVLLDFGIDPDLVRLV